MKISQVSNITNKNNVLIKKSSPNFKWNKQPAKLAYNKYLSQGVINYLPKNSLSTISDIKPLKPLGTTCKDAIPLKNFWRTISLKDRRTIQTNKWGASTNKDGFAGSFLKSRSCIPISTSYVHDCAVMYFYNQKTKEHALYHAGAQYQKEVLDDRMRCLMPNGFTHGAIIPGDYLFSDEHKHNMHNMFEIMKKYCPDAMINVYRNSSRYPEIVGYKGGVFEIPNKRVIKQINRGYNPVDFGQATFKIAEANDFETFKYINTRKTIEELENLKKVYLKQKISKELTDVLINKINKNIEIITQFEKCKTLEELNNYVNKNGYECFDAYVERKNKLLSNKNQEIIDIVDLETTQEEKLPNREAKGFFKRLFDKIKKSY